MSRPITQQRSAWMKLESDEMLGVTVQWWARKVHDGVLRACVGDEPQGWHLSISFHDNRSRLSRYPNWDEILHAREQLLPADVEFAMFLPRPEDYVALHDTTFHLHEHPERA